MPNHKVVKVIIDTNIFISFLIGKKLKGLKDVLSENSIELIFCEQIITEVILTSSQPKLKKYFPESAVKELVELVKAIGDENVITSIPKLCRDTKDNFLLGLASVSKADILVTGDKDLLEIERFKSTVIVTYKEFEKIIAQLHNKGLAQLRRTTKRK